MAEIKNTNPFAWNETIQKLTSGDITLSELNGIKGQIESEIEARKEKERQEKENVVLQKIEALQDKKELILSLIQHGRTSCSDEHKCNGWDGERARCNKCHLTEILNGEWGGRFDFSISVDIWEVR